MGHRLARLHKRNPLLVPVLVIASTITVERVAFQVGRNLLPLIQEELGDAARYLPFAMSAGGLLGFVAWLLAGVLGAGRRGAVGFLGGLVAAGAVATFAPSAAVLLAASGVAGLAGFGGSILLATACERLAGDSPRRDLNHRASALSEVGTPLLAAGVTLLAAGGDWRLAMAVGALGLPGLVLAPLLGAHVAGGPPAPGAASGRELRRALDDIRAQLRDRAVMLGAVAAAATCLSLIPFSSLMALALHDDGIGLGVVAAITLLGLPTVLIGHFWERWLGHRPRAALVVSFGPAFAGWALVLVVETLGEQWSTPVQIALWGAAAVTIRLGLFTTMLVARGLALSVGDDGPLPAGAVSVRSALQMLPSAAAGALSLLVAPLLYDLGHGLAPSALVGLGLLIGAVLMMHRAHA